MQRTKTASFAVIVLAIAVFLVLTPVGSADDKKPPVTLKIGQDVQVEIKDKTAVDRGDRIPDAALAAAFCYFDADADNQFAFAERMARTAQGASVDPNEGAVGGGRIAILKRGDYLVVVPDTPEVAKEGDAFLVLLYRLLDHLYQLAGDHPGVVRVVTFGVTESGREKIGSPCDTSEITTVVSFTRLTESTGTSSKASSQRPHCVISCARPMI